MWERRCTLTSLESLDPRFVPVAEAFVAALKAQQIPHVVTSTRRTAKEQYALWCQGRKPLDEVNAARLDALMPSIGAADNTYVVTKADGKAVLSNHQSGLAMDVVPMNRYGEPVWPYPSDPRWERIAAVGEALGLEWGGRWKDFPDYPHWQMVV